MAQCETVLAKRAFRHFRIFFLAACLLCSTSLLGQEVTPGSPTDHIAVITVDPSAPGKTMPAAFLGLSHEWGQAQLLMGDPAVGTNAIYRQLLNNLLVHGKHLVIRVGGGTTDKNQAADAEMVRPLAALFSDFSKPQPQLSFILGLNLGANDPSLASRQAKAFVGQMPAGAISAIELGHQPDTYAQLKYRPAGYTFADYLADVNRFSDEIRKAVPAAPRLMGPSITRFSTGASRPGGFGSLGNFQKLVQQPEFGVLSQNAYAERGSSCGGNPQPGSLLQAVASTPQVEPFTRAAQAAGRPLRIAELAAISCSGEAGISNAFEAALWASDILFEYAKAGVDGVNILTNNWNAASGWDISGAFLFNVPEGQYRSAKTVPPPTDHQFSSEYGLRAVLPLYYGMLMFAEATANQAKLVPVQLSTAGNVKAWATLDEQTGVARVLVINKEQQLLGKVKINFPGYTVGSAKRLMAPSFRSQSGITYGGLTFDGSQDGKPLGKEEREEVTAADGAFELAIGPTSALLITLKK